MNDAGSRRPRGPGFVYGVLSVVLVVVVAVVALTARQTPPPTIAEFAPQAQQQIKDAPTEQSSKFGSAAGDAFGDDRPTPEPSAAPGATPRPKVDTHRVRRCIGDPPRQTEDPQSPPCIAYWQGSNGGATSDGVTADEISVVIPTTESPSVLTLYQDLESFFNARYEFYGRRLVFKYGRTDGGANDAPTQRADAQTYSQQYHPFASQSYKAATGFFYSDEMTRHGVVTMTKAVINVTSPTLWEYAMNADAMFATIGDWACTRLTGRPAAHAGDPTLKTQTRVYGIYQENYDGAGDTDRSTSDALKRKLEACGAQVPVAERNSIDTNGDNPAQAAALMLSMKQRGVTSVICLCQLFNFGVLQTAASKEAFLPEWIVSTYGVDDENGFIKAGGNAPDEMASTFGLTFTPRQVKLTDEPVVWAAKEVDPGYSLADTSGTVDQAFAIYHSLLVLASGIQMAGPRLTSQTFADGLRRTVFPNPDYPTKPGKVGFADGSHSMTRDAAEFWWSNTANPPYTGDGAGTYCYVDGGARHSIGTFPPGPDPFFSGPCDSGA